MATRDELEELRDSAPARSTLRAQAEAAARRRVWATGPIHDISPLAAERGGSGFGKALEGKPDDLSNIHCFLFDDHDWLVASRVYSALRPSSRYTERFVVYPNDDLGIAYSFDDWAEDDDAPVAVAKLEFSHHRPSTITTLGRPHLTTELFRWGDHGPVEISVTIGERPTHHYTVTYVNGTLDAIFVARGAVAEPIFMTSPPGLAASLSELRGVLATSIVAAVSEEPPAEVVYCAALPYSPESRETVVPDEILLGRAAVQPPASEGLEQAYAPYALEDAGAMVLEIESEALTKLCAKIALAMGSDDDYERVRRTLISIAGDLSQRDWSDVLSVTSDFVFVPINLDGSDIEENLREVRALANPVPE